MKGFLIPLVRFIYVLLDIDLSPMFLSKGNV